MAALACLSQAVQSLNRIIAVSDDCKAPVSLVARDAKAVVRQAQNELFALEKKEAESEHPTTTEMFMSRAGFTQPKPQWFYRSDNKGGDYKARRMSDGYFNVQYWPLDAKEFVYEMTFPSNCDFETWAKCELV